MQETLKSLFKSAVFDGALLIVFGLILVLFPRVSLQVLCAVLGAILIAMSILKFVALPNIPGTFGRAMEALVALIELVLGFALIVQADFFISLFQVIIGVVLVFGSLLLLFHAYEIRSLGGSWFVCSIVAGVLVLALGVLVILNPAEFAEIAFQLQGIALIIEGVSFVVFLRSMKKNVDAVETAIRDSAPIVVEAERVESIPMPENEQGRTSYYGDGGRRI